MNFWSKPGARCWTVELRGIPREDISANKDVGRAGGGNLGLCSGAHVGASAEVVRKTEDVGVATRH